MSIRLAGALVLLAFEPYALWILELSAIAGPEDSEFWHTNLGYGGFAPILIFNGNQAGLAASWLLAIIYIPSRRLLKAAKPDLLNSLFLVAFVAAVSIGLTFEGSQGRPLPFAMGLVSVAGGVCAFLAGGQLKRKR